VNPIREYDALLSLGCHGSQELKKNWDVNITVGVPIPMRSLKSMKWIHY